MRRLSCFDPNPYRVARSVVWRAYGWCSHLDSLEWAWMFFQFTSWSASRVIFGARFPLRRPCLLLSLLESCLTFREVFLVRFSLFWRRTYTLEPKIRRWCRPGIAWFYISVGQMELLSARVSCRFLIKVMAKTISGPSMSLILALRIVALNMSIIVLPFLYDTPLSSWE